MLRERRVAQDWEQWVEDEHPATVSVTWLVNAYCGVESAG